MLSCLECVVWASVEPETSCAPAPQSTPSQLALTLAARLNHLRFHAAACSTQWDPIGDGSRLEQGVVRTQRHSRCLKQRTPCVVVGARARGHGGHRKASIPLPPSLCTCCRIQVLRGPDPVCESLRVKERKEEQDALDKLVALEQEEWDAAAANRARVQLIKDWWVLWAALRPSLPLVAIGLGRVLKL
jgi:hypothetical protein